MPAPEPALGGARLAGLARVAERAPKGRIALKDDLGASALRASLEEAVGVSPPGRLRFVEGAGGWAAWMAPDELLLAVPRERLVGTLDALDRALVGEHALVADVSDLRAAFTVESDAARDVRAKLVPIDLGPDAFGPGAFRRTRLAQVAAAIAREAPGRFEILVARSVALYAFEALCTAADPDAPLRLHERNA